MLEEVIVDGCEYERQAMLGNQQQPTTTINNHQQPTTTINNHQQPLTTINNQQQPTTTNNNNNQQQWLNLVDGCEGQAGAERSKGSEGEGSKQAAALSRAPFASDPFSVIFIFVREIILLKPV